MEDAVLQRPNFIGFQLEVLHRYQATERGPVDLQLVKVESSAKGYSSYRGCMVSEGQ